LSFLLFLTRRRRSEQCACLCSQWELCANSCDHEELEIGFSTGSLRARSLVLAKTAFLILSFQSRAGFFSLAPIFSPGSLLQPLLNGPGRKPACIRRSFFVVRFSYSHLTARFRRPPPLWLPNDGVTSPVDASELLDSFHFWGCPGLRGCVSAVALTALKERLTSGS
jgi:hypothetical protein